MVGAPHGEPLLDSSREGGPEDPLGYERGCWGRGFSRIAGVDEVGRGPLAGPVVAAAVILRPGQWIEGATDSKRLSRRAREELDGRIVAEALSVGIGAASVREIDRRNILHATRLAMVRAVRALPTVPDHIVVDGLPLKGAPWPHDAVVKGDRRVHTIGCASIVAKVCRDRLMCRLAARYPRYRWDSNMGYGTADHLRALGEWGPSAHHRLTFRPLQLELELEG